ncbi:MAG TPA: rhodanese-like domain-containing protein, partial [Dehalococcoidia bacterium]|nr:rhodanese-like domain-containing protein [Dehalococcoidia bacterium]
MARAISPADLIARRSGPANYALIDVQEKGEFNLAQIEGASPVPRGDFEWRIGQLVPNPSVPLILYCSDGRRSALAAATAERLGYQDVSYLEGGLEAWRAAGQQTIEGWGVPGKDYGEKVAVVEDIPQITPEELAERQAKGERFVILDSRTVPEYEANHLPGAYAVPGGQLPIEVIDLIGEGDPTVVVNCAGRTRSILGAHLLRRMGLPKVTAFKNGTMAWHMAGYQLERGPDPRGEHAPSPEARAAAERFADRLVAEENLESMTPEELRALQESGELHYLIDVRLPAEYEAGHIPGAISCQAGQLALTSEQIVGVRSAPIVMTCDGRAR